MKTTHIVLLAAALSLGASSSSASSYFSMGMGGGDSRTTLTIKSDGNCQLRSENTQTRAAMEMQMRAYERFAKMAESEEEDEAKPAPPDQPVKTDQKALSDEELVKRIRDSYTTRLEMMGEAREGNIEAVDVTSNSVRIVTSRAFGSLKELLSENLWSWGPTLLMFEDARFETDTNGQFRVTFTPAKGADRYLKSTTREWKRTKMNFEWRLVLPGKVVSSGMPETSDNSTWLAIDSGKPESVEAALKLIGSPLIILAEAGGLNLTDALESKKLARATRQGTRIEPDLPVTDAGPGFVAEPASVTVSTVYYFPDGEKQLQAQPSDYYSLQSTGTTVVAKLFPPKGRTIQSVSGLRVIKAKDDKGRAIAGAGEEGEDNEADLTEMVFSRGNSDRTGTVRLNLRLGLPAGDAQTIEELEAEGIVLSIGGWKELLVTNVQADAQKEIDLSEVLPGAKLFITKVTLKKPQTTVQARLEGPAGVDQLDVKFKTTAEHGSTHTSSQRSKTSGDKTVRSITIQGYDFETARGSSSAEPLTLIVRIPQDAKRERVRFKLNALDLL